MYDLIVIGAGPAGLTATVYALNKRLEVLLVCETLGGKAGGRMRLQGLGGYETIDGEETVRKFTSRLETVDFARLTDRAVAVEPVPGPGGCERFQVRMASGACHATRALIVATGAEPRAVGVPGERELAGLGVSYSAVSHAPLMWGHDAAVVGDGELAMRAASELADVARRVYVVAPRGALGASPLATSLRDRPNVTVFAGHALESVEGGDYLAGMTLRAPDGTRQSVPVAGLFVALGLEPCTALVEGVVDRDEAGHIRVDARGATSRAGVFAAGDVTDAFSEQVLIAIGDGARATLAAHEYLLRHPRTVDEPFPPAPLPRPEQDW